MSIDKKVGNLINNLEPEFRIPVVNALRLSDGSFISFQQELAAQVWEMPTLPVQDIIDRLSVA